MKAVASGEEGGGRDGMKAVASGEEGGGRDGLKAVASGEEGGGRDAVKSGFSPVGAGAAGTGGATALSMNPNNTARKESLNAVE